LAQVGGSETTAILASSIPGGIGRHPKLRGAEKLLETRTSVSSMASKGDPSVERAPQGVYF